MCQHPEDRSLLAAARRGEPAAVEGLVRRLGCIPAMLRVRERRIGVKLSPEERAEIVQETALALWSKLHQYTGHRPFEAWVWGFVIRQHMKVVEGRRRNARVELAPDQPSPHREEELDPEDRATVRATVEELGEPDSRILILRHFDEQPFAAIAHEMCMPMNTIKSRYYRALDRLRATLSPLWKEDAE